MPSRLISLAILIYWSVAAFYLLTGEVLPELSLGYPPDLRAIAKASDGNGPVKWTMEVLDGKEGGESTRTVGEAITSSSRLPDGRFEMGTRVSFDAGELLKGTPLGIKASVRLKLESIYRIDPSGNLKSFDLTVTPVEASEALFTVRGRLTGGTMEIVSRGPVAMLNQTLHIPYQPRGVVHDSLGPFDRLPGLHVGQRWDTQVVNPFTGQVERVRVEVDRRTLLHWDGEPISAFEVVQRSKAMTARTWVRPDGLIFRQEVPLPIVKLVLERVPDRSRGARGEGVGP
ncbi:MAG: hypothetical protein U0790_10575 [Isosphaeraceae bacterium]